jgi:hypothetical protein
MKTEESCVQPQAKLGVLPYRNTGSHRRMQQARRVLHREHVLSHVLISDFWPLEPWFKPLWRFITFLGNHHVHFVIPNILAVKFEPVNTYWLTLYENWQIYHATQGFTKLLSKTSSSSWCSFVLFFWLLLETKASFSLIHSVFPSFFSSHFPKKLRVDRRGPA